MLNQIRKRLFITIIEKPDIGIRTFLGNFRNNKDILESGIHLHP